jgi:hypothetical protein
MLSRTDLTGFRGELPQDTKEFGWRDVNALKLAAVLARRNTSFFRERGFNFPTLLTTPDLAVSGYTINLLGNLLWHLYNS